MRAIGIVCEYNPFHNGHLYQIEESRRRLGGDAAVVCVMSGDFVQRGEAACFSKFPRAEAACRSGADLVVELPLPWCLSSAEGFASGAVSILAALGCTHLSFGSEGGELDKLKGIAAFINEPETGDEIQRLLSQDARLSYARARQLAAEKEFGREASLLSQPNNILAVEYLKTLIRNGYPLEPIAVSRIGSAHDSEGEGEFPSAMQLRNMLAEGEDITRYLPAGSQEVFRREIKAGRMKNERVLEAALLSRLYALAPEDFDKLPDAEGGVGRRLYRALWQGNGLEEIVRLAASKRFTAARMRRMLISAALGGCADDTKGVPPYIRVLAANEKGMELLRNHAENSRIPVLGRAGDVKKLGRDAERVFTMTAQAHAVYCQQFVSNDDRNPNSDWRHGILFVNNDELPRFQRFDFVQE